jgi:hypothetical protein
MIEENIFEALIKVMTCISISNVPASILRPAVPRPDSPLTDPRQVSSPDRRL